MMETARRKAGRPPLPPHRVKKDRKIWLSDEDMELILALTGQPNLTRAFELLAQEYDGKDTDR